jgi:hypothetical protein
MISLSNAISDRRAAYEAIAITTLPTDSSYKTITGLDSSSKPDLRLHSGIGHRLSGYIFFQFVGDFPHVNGRSVAAIQAQRQLF